MKTSCYRGVPLLGFAAYSGSGKTTLLRQLIPGLRKRGLRVALVKHAHHDFDIDYPGKDSYELRKAGADQVIVGSAHRWALVLERDTDREPELSEFLSQLTLERSDIILVEGFRDVQFPKIEIHRQSQNRAPFYVTDPYIIAIVSDGLVHQDSTISCFRPDAIEALLDFIETYREKALHY